MFSLFLTHGICDIQFECQNKSIDYFTEKGYMNKIILRKNKSICFNVTNSAYIFLGGRVSVKGTLILERPSSSNVNQTETFNKELKEVDNAYGFAAEQGYFMVTAHSRVTLTVARIDLHGESSDDTIYVALKSAFIASPTLKYNSQTKVTKSDIYYIINPKDSTIKFEPSQNLSIDVAASNGYNDFFSEEKTLTVKYIKVKLYYGHNTNFSGSIRMTVTSDEVPDHYPNVIFKLHKNQIYAERSYFSVISLILLILFITYILVILIPSTSKYLNISEYGNKATEWLRGNLQNPIPIPNPNKSRRSRPTSRYENRRNRVVSKSNQKVYSPDDFDNTYSPFPPSSYTLMFISKNPARSNQIISPNSYQSNRSVDDNSLVENMRLYHQNQKRNYQKTSPNPHNVEQSSQEYWDHNSPNSRKRIIESAFNPKVEYVKVIEKPEKHVYDEALKAQPKTEAPAQLPTNSFTIPPPPKSKDAKQDSKLPKIDTKGFNFGNTMKNASPMKFEFKLPKK